MATQWICQKTRQKRWPVLLLQQDQGMPRQGSAQNQDLCLLMLQGCTVIERSHQTALTIGAI